MVRVFVLTNDKYIWAIQPFMYLFNIYWSALQPVIVAGYKNPPFQLPKNAYFFKIADKNYPPERWSDSLIRVLDAFTDEFIVLMLEDYFLTRTVDCQGVNSLAEFMRLSERNILRIDLSTDRLYALGDGRSAVDIGPWGHYDLIETYSGTPYQMSFQAGLWNRKLLRSLLIPNRTPWETEIYTQVPPEMRVLGTRQWPVRYINAIEQGKLMHDRLNRIEPSHLEEVKKMIGKYAYV